jgi:2-deoxy-D-gluconate 3-dehydrogenase
MAGNGSLFDLSGRVAVVTGGNRGIGHAMALGLARAGASVAVLARNAEQNQLVLAELKAIGKPALVLPLDVTDRAALAPAVAEVERTLGAGIDILVNNAGIVALTGGVLNETADVWDKTIETHLNASFLLSQLVAKSMVKRKSGATCNTVAHRNLGQESTMRIRLQLAI